MSRRTLSWLIGGGIALVALALVLTTVPVVTGESRTKDASAAAIGWVDEHDCLDVTFEAPITYSVTRPLLDVWGLARVAHVTLDHEVVSVAARPECTEGLSNVGATAYVNAPVCESGLCEGANISYQTGRGESPTEAAMSFSGADTLPGSGVTSSPWCLEFAALIQYTTIGGGYSDSARVTESDFCLDIS